MRSPHRFNILLAVPVAVLAGLGIATLSEIGQRARWLAVLVGALILFEYLRMPLSTLSLAYSPFYDELAANSGRFAVYDLPMGFSGPAKFYMYLQTIHGKPVVQGKMARPERGINAFIDGDPFTRHLRITRKQIDPDLTAVSRHLSYLADADVRYLILHRDGQLEGARPSDEEWSAWQEWLTIEPLLEDDRIAVYPTSLRYGRDFGFDVDLGSSVGIVQVSQMPESPTQGEELALTLHWGSREAPERDLRVRLSLVDGIGLTHQSIVASPCADWPTGDWPSGAIALGRYRFQLDPHLPPGRYAIQVELLGRGHPAEVASFDLRSLPRTFEVPESMGDALDARFGRTFTLLGYDFTQDEKGLKLTLHWQANQRPQKSYKVFVHLFDPETGSVVAQDDAVPRDWAYPTTWWEAGEVVSDEIRLSTHGVPQGEYVLNVGMYHLHGGERLAAVDGGGRKQPQGRITLQEVTIE
jgi:hypothetical protein